MMKYVFLVESGTSSGENPTFVVGVIIDESQLDILCKELKAVIAKHIPPEDQAGFLIHATDIFNRKRYFKNHDWGYDERMNILKDVLDIMVKYKLPVAMGYHIGEEDYRIKYPFAFYNCLDIAGKFNSHFSAHKMKITAENIDGIKGKLQEHYKELRGENSPLKNIYKHLGSFDEVITFAKKEEEPLLQFADVFAFTSRRGFNGCSRAQSILNSYIEGFKIQAQGIGHQLLIPVNVSIIK